MIIVLKKKHFIERGASQASNPSWVEVDRWNTFREPQEVADLYGAGEYAQVDDGQFVVFEVKAKTVYEVNPKPKRFTT